MTDLEIATLAIASVGLILGMRSEWRNHVRDRVAIRVIPKVAYPIGPVHDPRPCFAIDIINEGAFPVTVDDAGLLVKGAMKRAALCPPVILDGGTWPRRLEPHSSVTVYSVPPEQLGIDFSKLGGAYVITASERTFRGYSQAFKRVAQLGRIPDLPHGLSRAGLPGMITVKDFDA